MAYENDAHIWMSHGTHTNGSYECVMVSVSHLWIHMYEEVMSHVWMSHDTRMNGSWHTNQWHTSHISSYTHMKESCHTYESVTARMDKSWRTYQRHTSHIPAGTHTCEAHRRHITPTARIRARHTCEVYMWGTSHLEPIRDRVPHNLDIVSKQLKQIETTRILPMGFTMSTYDEYHVITWYWW